MELHQNTTIISSKYHPNFKKYHKIYIEISEKFRKNSGSSLKKVNGISSE